MSLPNSVSGAGKVRASFAVGDAASRTSYDAFVVCERAKWGLPPRAKGTAQYTTGSGWRGFQPGGRTNLAIGDLQFAMQ